jgi:antitoxin VapB
MAKGLKTDEIMRKPAKAKGEPVAKETEEACASALGKIPLWERLQPLRARLAGRPAGCEQLASHKGFFDAMWDGEK